MNSERAVNFYKLLHEIECCIGNRCYNDNILNWESHGVLESVGRRYRYPVTFSDSERTEDKYWDDFPSRFSYETSKSAPYILGEKEHRSAYYKFGSNDLFIFGGIREALEMLEKRFYIDFDQLLEDEKKRGSQYDRRRVWNYLSRVERVNIMNSERAVDFYKLLHEIEYCIGKKCYSNWSSTTYRYPVTFLDSERTKSTYKSDFPFKFNLSGELENYILGEKEHRSAHYKFGSNDLFIFGGIREALEMLKKRFYIDFDQLLEDEKKRGSQS